MRQYIAELIGTFFLVLTVGFAVVSGNRLVPVAIGVVLAAGVVRAVVTGAPAPTPGFTGRHLVAASAGGAAAAYMFRALNPADA